MRSLAILLATFLMLQGNSQNDKFLTVDISGFEATQAHNCIQLEWNDYDPENLLNIKIQKSYDGIFSDCNLGIDSEKNENEGCLQYKCTDHVEKSGTVYYRLKRCDKFGNSKFSKIVAVKYEYMPAEAILFPNPVTAKEFYVNTGKAPHINIEIYNNEGRQVYSNFLNSSESNSVQKIEIPFVEKGVYRCIIKGEGDAKNVSLVVSE